eukprot:GEMP01083015.1.p1 GENE.GEMP01083015.1~~GEMP01083015.1.p1  ORF type:complete len:227 (+),score=13.43 GEMP01083015.1:42-683(+)
MASSLAVDFEKAMRGKEISEACIDVTGTFGFTSTECSDSDDFRNRVLPHLCGQGSTSPIEFKSSEPTLQLIASYQKEYDELQDGDDFEFWFPSASARDADSGRNCDFFGRIKWMKSKKVSKNHGAFVHKSEFFSFFGVFRKRYLPNQYEIKWKRILGETVIEYVRDWRICKDRFIREEETVRNEPLTADEVDCLLEYEKYKFVKTHGKSTYLQ